MRCMLERPPSVAWPSIRTSRSKAAVMKNKDIARTKEVAGAKANIFIVGPANPELSSLQSYVGSFGFNVVRCRSAGEVSRLSNSQSPAVCLLTLAADQRGATATISDLVDKLHCGLIVLAETGDASDRVIGLELGADDYLTKPFEQRELIARIRSVVRRNSDCNREQSYSVASFGKWNFSPATLELRNEDGRTETLTASESDLLISMISRPNRLLSREQLQHENDWVDDPAFERSIDVRISRLRKKIECDPRSPSYIKTIYGAGYIFCAAVSWK